MAGHIGFELRCAERKFISLTSRRNSDFRDTARWSRSPGRIIFSARAGLFPDRSRPLAHVASGAVSLRHIEVRIFSRRQVGFELRCAGRRFSSFKPHLGAMLGRSRNDCGAKTSQKIAHFLLDFLCKQSVSGGQRSPHAERLRLQGPQSSPPPAPLCLRGVAVVAANGAPRPREEPRHGQA